jgi:hypothetical protein
LSLSVVGYSSGLTFWYDSTDTGWEWIIPAVHNSAFDWDTGGFIGIFTKTTDDEEYLHVAGSYSHTGTATMTGWDMWHGLAMLTDLSAILQMKAPSGCRRPYRGKAARREIEDIKKLIAPEKKIIAVPKERKDPRKNDAKRGLPPLNQLRRARREAQKQIDLEVAEMRKTWRRDEGKQRHPAVPKGSGPQEPSDEEEDEIEPGLIVPSVSKPLVIQGKIEPPAEPRSSSKTRSDSKGRQGS